MGEVRCMTCRKQVGELFHDPWTPPLSKEPCICCDCKLAALQNSFDEARDLYHGVKNELEEFERSLVKKTSDAEREKGRG